MSSPSQVLPVMLKIFSVFSMATGTLDIALGISMADTATTTGKPSSSTTATAFIDSQLRFTGAMWGGYGVMLWWASNDLRTRQTPLALLGGIMLAGGVGRMLSGWRHGFGATWVKVAMWVELLGPGIVYALIH